MKFTAFDLGLIDYRVAEEAQLELLKKVKSGGLEHALILCEFLPVFTIGRSGSSSNLLVSLDFLDKNGIRLYQVNRGGDITAHNPGQLVAYPIFNLALLKKDLNWYLRSLEEAILRLLSEYGVFGMRRPGLTGVWVNDKKIASIGISVSRWVASHGLSFNVNNDLSIFDLINPCGIKDAKVSSLSELLKFRYPIRCETSVKGHPIDIAEIKTKLIAHFEAIFGVSIDADVKTAGVA